MFPKNETKEKMDATKDHSRVSPEGKALGERMARIADKACARLAAQGEADERCKTCAFRAGTVPNGCMQTQLDVLKAVVEDEPFLCHHDKRNHTMCHGWFAVGVLKLQAQQARGYSFNMPCPWEFSPADEDKK